MMNFRTFFLLSLFFCSSVLVSAQAPVVTKSAKERRAGTVVIDEMKSKLRSRKEKMFELLSEQGGSAIVYEQAFTKEFIKEFPDEIGGDLEKREDFEGTVDFLHSDHFDEETAHNFFKISRDGPGANANFFPIGAERNFLSGTRVRVENTVSLSRGFMEGRKMSLHKKLFSDVALAAETPPADSVIASVVGLMYTPPLLTKSSKDAPQEIDLVLARFSGGAYSLREDQLPRPDEVEDRINGPIASFFETSSYGNFYIRGNSQLKKWIDIDPFPVPATGPTMGVSAMEQSVLERAVEQGVDFCSPAVYKAKRRLVFVIGAGELFPTAFGASGFSSVGFQRMVGVGGVGGCDFEASISFVFLGKGTLTERVRTFFAVSIGASEFDRVFIHEFGHALGALHASSVECSPKTLGMSKDDVFSSLPMLLGATPRINVPYSNLECDFLEYGNRYDVMGNGEIAVEFGLRTKTIFNWLGTISEVAESSRASVLSVPYPDFEGEYALKLMGQEGLVGLVLPFYSNDRKSSPIYYNDYYLEYRYDPRTPLIKGGLLINGMNFYLPYLLPPEQTVAPFMSLPSFLGKPPFSRIRNLVFYPGTSFVDLRSDVKITVNEASDSEIKFSLVRCGEPRYGYVKVTPFQAVPVSLFQSDFNPSIAPGGVLTLNFNFRVANTSACSDYTYKVIPFPTGSRLGPFTIVGSPVFSKNEFKLKPKEEIEISLKLNIKVVERDVLEKVMADNEPPDLPSLDFAFMLESEEPVLTDRKSPENGYEAGKSLLKIPPPPIGKKDREEKRLRFQYVSSLTELGDDLQPTFLNIRTKEGDVVSVAEGIEFVPGTTLSFKAGVLNKSKNTNPSHLTRNFPAQFTVTNGKGDVVAASSEYMHPGMGAGENTSGIPESLLKDATSFDSNNVKKLKSALFDWKIPDDIASGVYTVTYEVNPRGMAEEITLENNWISNFVVVDRSSVLRKGVSLSSAEISGKPSSVSGSVGVSGGLSLSFEAVAETLKTAKRDILDLTSTLFGMHEADINGDGEVDIIDLSFVANDFGRDGDELKGDVNKDKVVDIADLVLVGRDFGK